MFLLCFCVLILLIIICIVVCLIHFLLFLHRMFIIFSSSSDLREPPLRRELGRMKNEGVSVFSKALLRFNGDEFLLCVATYCYCTNPKEYSYIR